jgi:hypothetical protein
VIVVIHLAPYDLLGGLYDHGGDLLAQLAQGRLLLALYLLASPPYHPVALVASLALGPLALGLTLLSGLLAYLARLVAGLLDLLPVILQKLASLFPSLLRLVYGLLDGLLALADLVPDRRVDEPGKQRNQDQEGYDLPEDQAGVGQIENTCRVKHVLSSSLALLPSPKERRL